MECAGPCRDREWQRPLSGSSNADISQYFVWIETKGKTLEEIDALFYKDAPASLDVLEAARNDKDADVAAVVRHIEQQPETDDPDHKSLYAV